MKANFELTVYSDEKGNLKKIPDCLHVHVDETKETVQFTIGVIVFSLKSHDFTSIAEYLNV